MAWHGGFGAVATVSGQLIEGVMRAYVAQGGPMYFPAPVSISVGAGVVGFNGIFEMLPPTIELVANPGNLVTIHFAFRSILQANFVQGPISLVRQYNVELRGAVTLAIITNIQNNSVVLGINTSSVVFAPLTAVTLSGPALPAQVKQALESPTLAAIATAFVQSRPNILVTPPTLKTVIEKVQPGNFPDVGTSIFNWFTIRLEASRIVVKVFGGGIHVAVDFRGLTSGDFNQLGSGPYLRGNIWMEKVTPEVWEQQGTPYIEKGSYPRGGSDFAVLFNMGVLSAIVDSISRQTAHTRISQNVELRGLSAGYSTFTKPLYPGLRDGLKIGFQATVHPSDINVFGALYFQPTVTVYDGPTAFLRVPSWSLRVAHSELSTAWYVDLAVFAVSAIAGAVLPGLFPVFLVGAVAVTDGILPGLLRNARNAALKGVEKALLGLGLPSPEDKRALPGLPGGYWSGTIHHITVTPDGLDMAIKASAGTNDLGSRLIFNASPVRSSDPQGWHAEYRRPMPFSVKLSQPIEKIAGNLSVVWQVYRTDNNALLRTVNRSYLADDILFKIDPKAIVSGVQLDPDTNGILIGLRDKDYYFLDGLRVRCTVKAKLGTQTGDIWSSEVVVKIDDNLDRHRKFVEWGPHRVYFMNSGTKDEVWSHDRTSRIHRTATGARCMMLRWRASDSPRKRPKFRYFDTLPHKWDELFQHRHYLCEYCFFGGPDKTTPYSQDDWF